ncbi:MAG: ABC transporter ATP-binding protein [Pseudomonadota bacterium]
MRIILQNLTKSYRDADRELTVINQVNFSFPESGSVAIIGRSGIGKSTLLHLLGGLDMPSSGSVSYGDAELSSMSSDARAAFRARNIGFIFQFHHLLPEFSALENVAMPLTIGGVSDAEALELSAGLLKRLGLSSREGHLPSQLSGGEQQRVAIARALVARPRVVLADEPTGNLDVRTAQEVQEIVLEMNRELKNVLIIVTHNNELARSMDLVVEMMPGGALVPVDRPQVTQGGN